MITGGDSLSDIRIVPARDHADSSCWENPPTPPPPTGPPLASAAVIAHPSAHPDPPDPFPAPLPFHHPFVTGDVPSIQKFVDGGVLGASRQGVKGERMRGPVSVTNCPNFPALFQFKNQKSQLPGMAPRPRQPGRLGTEPVSFCNGLLHSLPSTDVPLNFTPDYSKVVSQLRPHACTWMQQGTGMQGGKGVAPRAALGCFPRPFPMCVILKSGN